MVTQTPKRHDTPQLKSIPRRICWCVRWTGQGGCCTRSHLAMSHTAARKNTQLHVPPDQNITSWASKISDHPKNHYLVHIFFLLKCSSMPLHAVWRIFGSMQKTVIAHPQAPTFGTIGGQSQQPVAAEIAAVHHCSIFASLLGHRWLTFAAELF